MSTLYSVGIRFFLRKGKKDKQQIYLLLSHKGKNVRISTGYTIQELKWNAQNQKVMGSDAIAKSINNSLDILRLKVVEATNILSVQSKAIQLNTIKAILEGDRSLKHEYTLLNAAKQHNLEMEAMLGVKYAEGNYKNYRSTYRFLQRFVKQELKGNDMLLNELDLPLIRKLENWLLLKTTSNQNGAMKHIQRVKKVVNWAVSIGWIKHNPIAGYKVVFDRYERGFLNEEDIARLETAKFEGNIDMYRILFLFQIYTGLAFSDIAALKWTNIQWSDNGTSWIVQPRQKTRVTSNIPLLPKAKAILKGFMEGKERMEYVFKVGANQTYNRCLKTIAMRLGINKRLTTHIARHTFATTITLSNGIPMETVSRMLGHTKISTTQIYSKVTIDKIARDMDKLMNK